MNAVRVRGLTVSFPQRGGEPLRVLDGLDLDLPCGTIVGLVGRSGCGKSTLARALVGLQRCRESTITLPTGEELVSLGRHALAATRPRLQLVFQDPYAAFDPHLPVQTSLVRYLRRSGLTHEEARARLTEQLADVHLDLEHLQRLPRDLSGGQLQRIALLRAMLPDPTLLVADEIVSALDIEMADGVLGLLRALRSPDRSLLVVSHDIGAVLRCADVVAVMDGGRIVETASSDRLAHHQEHPVTRDLFAALPTWPEEAP